MRTIPPYQSWLPGSIFTGSATESVVKRNVMSKLKLAIVIGSIRPNRFGGHAAQWIEEVARRRGDFEVEFIDLKDYPMPLFAEEASPLYAPSKDEVARRWQKKVGEFDAFIFTAAEYNRGPTAVLKNALDYAYAEWGNKPVAFVGYGGVGGARAVEQLRLHAIELQMAPIRSAVHILFPDYLAVIKGGKPLSELEHLPSRCSISWHGGPQPSKQRARRVCARLPRRRNPMQRRRIRRDPAPGQGAGLVFAAFKTESSTLGTAAVASTTRTATAMSSS
jgi:NAD(P)H-dependent FMN reductase